MRNDMNEEIIESLNRLLRLGLWNHALIMIGETNNSLLTDHYLTIEVLKKVE